MGNCGGSESGAKKKPATTTTRPAKSAPPPSAPAKHADPSAPAPAPAVTVSFDEAKSAVKGEVLMISGCQDAQTSADVSDVTRFLEHRSQSNSRGPGGACTSSLLHVLEKMGGSPTWLDTLGAMRKFLQEHKYTQVPQLSSTTAHGMDEKFSIVGGQTGRKLAMLTGINYANTKAALDGCVNDVKRMLDCIISRGWASSPDDVKVFVDPLVSLPGDLVAKEPSKANLLAGIDWIVNTAQAGDVVYFHFSGHGVQVDDEDGSEEDGKDEALVPLDYQTARYITDDDIFEHLVSKLPDGVRLFALMDCCHSGTIFDLPYTIKASESLSAGTTYGHTRDLFAKQYHRVEKKKAKRSKKGGLNAVRAAMRMGGVKEGAKEEE